MLEEAHGLRQLPVLPLNKGPFRPLFPSTKDSKQLGRKWQLRRGWEACRGASHHLGLVNGSPNFFKPLFPHLINADIVFQVRCPVQSQAAFL